MLLEALREEPLAGNMLLKKAAFSREGKLLLVPAGEVKVEVWQRAALLLCPTWSRDGKPGWKGTLMTRPTGGIWMALERLSVPVPTEPWLWAALQCCPQGVGVGGGLVFRAVLAGRCELHPAARSKAPQPTTSTRKPLMPSLGAGRFAQGTHFPA